MVHVVDKDGQPLSCRTLLDTCSSANFISEKLVKTLRLSTRRCCVSVGAVNDLTTIAKSVATLTICSIHNGYRKTLTFFTIPRISDLVPNEEISRRSIPIPPNIRLADPTFDKPAPVDMLIGAGPTLSMFCVGQINLSQDGHDLMLQKTRLGWVIGGDIPSGSDMSGNQNSIKCHFSDLQFDISKFWEIEEGYKQTHFSAEEIACEKHFQKNTFRDHTGRYVVSLPFRDNQIAIGESRSVALQRLLSLERKLDRHLALREQYHSILEEYLHLGHMSKIHNDCESGFYLPHHAVFKNNSVTTKVRVVFDGSAKSKSGVSLNDTLMVGPTIQDDVFTHILRFRFNSYILVGDVEKMYRQFNIREEDRKFQKILWRRDGINIETFELNTVTFGLSSSPFLAIRSLRQLADDECQKYPKAANVLKKDVYVDDIVTGTESIEEGIQIRDELIGLLRLGGLNIRQWASNNTKLLEGISEGSVNVNLQFSRDKTLKTLGVSWNSLSDNIIYSVRPPTINSKISKRTILSEIAKIFDPLGLLGPVSLIAKILMQQLFQLKLDWDESVPSNIHTFWLNFCTELNLLNDLAFERRVFVENANHIQLHGFSDASEKGYGACIHIKSSNSQGQVLTKLLCAKSRVAPLKTVSLPRLELCGAQLLANLYSTVVKIINFTIDDVFFWTDSAITLAWINTSPHQLKTFVATRVSDIIKRTDPKHWRHIRSLDNPADALSRGQMPAQFVQNEIYKYGPEWLISEEAKWPTVAIEFPKELPEKKKEHCLMILPNTEFFNRFSSFPKLKRIVAYCQRFKITNRENGYLKAKELIDAEKTIIRVVQTTAFAKDVNDLMSKRNIEKKSSLISLNPFIDRDKLLRVGGRLQNSNVPHSQKHPILLPRNHHVTDLIIEQEHLRNQHAGIQTTLYALRRRFWPIDGRNQVRKIVRRCVKCFRANPPTVDYIMGNLPKERTTEAPPFYNTGVDYCGPFYIKEKKFRNRSRVKAYIAVFICLTVKAVHLEVISDMSTEGFLGALRRFIGRRGRPRSILSDNGSNFIGANNELKEIFELIRSEAHNTQVGCFLANQEIEWKFIPPLSPHFGGIWESNVKMFKHHFKRVISDILLTFEELNTFTIEVEAILNSRPLTPISTDPNDLLALTPGHFLIGNSLTSLPEIDLRLTPTQRLSRWQHIQKMRQDFWRRWNKEYLNGLNIRHKWKSGEHDIKEGTIVVLKEDNVPPMQWILGRVTKTFPGTDGIVRAVMVKTSKNELKRSVKKLAPLPIDERNSNEE